MRKLILFLAISFNVCLYGQNYNMSNATITTCSGNFYDNGGPSSNYSNNQNLVMTFISDNGNRISFNFSSFNLENGPDYLRIYDGPSTSYPLIGSYTGNQSPGVVTSTGTSLTFQFYSDNSVTYSGWSATISCTTPALPSYLMTDGQTIVGCSGVFYDNGGGNSNYSHNQNSVMTFCPSSGSDYLYIDFPLQFNISSDDTLYAYSGSDVNGMLIGKYTKNNKGERIVSPVAGECITFKFVSNSVNNEVGWQGLISCSSSLPVSSFTMGDGVRVICSGSFYDSGGQLANYSNNENKTMTFISDNGNRISFNFSSFNLENGPDYLRIYDGPSTSYPLIGTYTGNQSPGIVTSTGTSLTFQFYSDNSVTYSGWSATISCTTPALTSYLMTDGQTIVGCNGVFYDNGGGNSNYSHNQNSVMTFCPSSGSDYLYIDFPLQFNISSDDTLYAYSGSDVNGMLIGKYTKNNKGERIVSPVAGECITFKFVSNSVNNEVGWQGLISCSSSQVSPIVVLGSGTRVLCNGNFYDIGGPTGNYSNNMNNILTIISNSGCGIKVEFNSFITESSYDVLKVYDGISTNAPLLGTYSGNLSSFSVQSSGNALTFNFTTDGSTTFAGWSATLSCPNTPVATITPSGTVYICEGSSIILTASNGNSYQWNNGATSQSINVSESGTYIVTITNSLVCSAVSQPVNVLVNTLPVVTVLSNSPLCEGDTLNLSAFGGSTYSWSGPSNFNSNLQNPSIVNVTYNNSGTYFVTVTDNNGCSNSTNIDVNILLNPIPFITQNGDTLFSSSALSYQWLFNGQPINGANSQSYVVSQSGLYSVLVTNSTGCTNISNSIYITHSNVYSNILSDIIFTVKPIPFVDYVNISYYLPSNEYVELGIYNILGEKIFSIVEKYQVSGNYNYYIDCSKFSSGVYLVKFSSSKIEKRVKIIKHQ